MTVLSGAGPAEIEAISAFEGEFNVRRGSILRAALSQGRGRFGAILVVLIALLAAVGPFLVPHSPTDSVTAPFRAPSHAYPLGSDAVGRDVLSRILDGGYVILLIALCATAGAVVIGAVLGCFAALSSRLLDEAVMRLLDVLMSFPLLVLGLLFLSVLGDKLWLIALTVFLGHLPHVARTTRAAALAVRDREFVQYASSLGVSRLGLVFKELLPNVLGVILVEFGLRLGYSIGVVAALGFIGFGPPPPAPDWGGMISENLQGVLAQPWPVVAPVMCIAILTVGVNFFTDALAKAVGGLVRVQPKVKP
jgi:peptide/nickel transport system permease protein